MSFEFCVVDDITLGIMVDAAKYQQTILYKSYITIHFSEKQKFSIKFFVKYAFSG